MSKCKCDETGLWVLFAARPPTDEGDRSMLGAVTSDWHDGGLVFRVEPRIIYLNSEQIGILPYVRMGPVEYARELELIRKLRHGE